MQTTATVDPKATDRLIADYSRDLSTIRKRLEHNVHTLHLIAEDRLEHIGRQTRWQLSEEEAVTIARRLVEAGTVALTYRAAAPRTLDSYDGRRADAARLQHLISELEDVHRAHGWSRFFLVVGGHIHSSTSCHTLHPSTQIGWLPELSGESEADAVAEHGALLCTVCFPSAPVEWTNGRELEAAAKAADSCPGSLTFDYPRETARLGYVTGNYGVCKHCGKRTTVTANRKLRRHKI